MQWILIPLNAGGGARRRMHFDVSGFALRHREGSRIAPKHALAFCDARSRETMRKQSSGGWGAGLLPPQRVPQTVVDACGARSVDSSAPNTMSRQWIVVAPPTL
jgi:hypothetical protein